MASKTKWLAGAVNPEKKGLFDGVSTAAIRKELAGLRRTAPHKAGSKEATRVSELVFAIRARSKKGFRG